MPNEALGPPPGWSNWAARNPWHCGPVSPWAASASSASKPTTSTNRPEPAGASWSPAGPPGSSTRSRWPATRISPSPGSAWAWISSSESPPIATGHRLERREDPDRHKAPERSAHGHGVPQVLGRTHGHGPCRSGKTFPCPAVRAAVRGCGAPAPTRRFQLSGRPAPRYPDTTAQKVSDMGATCSLDAWRASPSGHPSGLPHRHDGVGTVRVMRDHVHHASGRQPKPESSTG